MVWARSVLPCVMADSKKSLFTHAEKAMAASDQRTILIRQLVEKERIAADAKTVRLKALRLAKEEADRAAAPPPKVAKKKASAKAKIKA